MIAALFSATFCSCIDPRHDSATQCGQARHLSIVKSGVKPTEQSRSVESNDRLIGRRPRIRACDKDRHRAFEGNHGCGHNRP